IVEIDEVYVGGKLRIGSDTQGKTKLDNKVPVVSVLQRGGKVQSRAVERVTAATLKPIIDEVLSRNPHLLTDTSTVLKRAGAGPKHSTVNHSAKEYARHEDGLCITTNTVEGYFSILKRGNYGVYHHW